MKVTGRKADAMMAAHLASEAALRLVKPGNDNIEVTETLNKVAESYECKVNIQNNTIDAIFCCFSHCDATYMPGLPNILATSQ